MALHAHEHLHGTEHEEPDLCNECGQGVSDCATFGCNPCSLCGESKDSHELGISERGPICPGQLEDLDIYTE